MEYSRDNPIALASIENGHSPWEQKCDFVITGEYAEFFSRLDELNELRIGKYEKSKLLKKTSELDGELEDLGRYLTEIKLLAELKPWIGKIEKRNGSYWVEIAIEDEKQWDNTSGNEKAFLASNIAEAIEKFLSENNIETAEVKITASICERDEDGYGTWKKDILHSVWEGSDKYEIYIDWKN